MTSTLIGALAALTMVAQTPPPAPPVLQPAVQPPPAASQPAKESGVKAGPKPGKVAEWFRATFGIDLQAYANLTGVRGGDERGAGARLIAYDITRKTETTLWQCGGCWSPVLVGESTAVLRIAAVSADQSEVWMVTSCGVHRVGGPLPLDSALVGTDRGTIYAAVPDSRCAAEATYRLVAIDSQSGAIADLPDSLCMGGASLPRAGRVRDDRIISSTPAQKADGMTQPRKLYVLAPAKGARPTASPLSLPVDDVDRFDPIWGGSDRVIYVARP
jgi:hypothetical protein